MLRKHKFHLDRKSLEIMYFTYIRPILEYGDIIWDNCTLYEKEELEKIQLEAARLVTGATKLVSRDLLYKESGWEKLSCRRRKHKLVTFYKMYNHLSPDYLSSLIPASVGNTSSYSLRNSENIHSIQCHSSLYNESFLPSAIREWNNLPLEARRMESLDGFKKFLDTDLVKPNPYFYSGSRLGQIYHTRLRTESSGLNQHLYNKNIVDSPLCACGEIEDNEHFLFTCPRFNLIRHDMFDCVSRCYGNVTTQLLIDGNDTLPVAVNEEAFDAVHRYILRSKRFQLS